MDWKWQKKRFGRAVKSKCSSHYRKEKAQTQTLLGEKNDTGSYQGTPYKIRNGWSNPVIFKNGENGIMVNL